MKTGAFNLLRINVQDFAGLSEGWLHCSIDRMIGSACLAASYTVSDFIPTFLDSEYG